MATVSTHVRIDENLKKQANELFAQLIDAMEEAKRISREPGTKRYKSFKEAMEDIDNAV